MSLKADIINLILGELQLIIQIEICFILLAVIFIKMESSMKLLSIKQTSEKWGLSPRRINVLCSEGRIPGAMKVGSYWVIPAEATKPKDERIKTGRYIKNRNSEGH